MQLRDVVVGQSRIAAFERMVGWLDIDVDVASTTTDIEAANNSATIARDQAMCGKHLLGYQLVVGSYALWCV